jgi:hypothetical protein
MPSSYWKTVLNGNSMLVLNAYNVLPVHMVLRVHLSVFASSHDFNYVVIKQHISKPVLL